MMADSVPPIDPAFASPADFAAHYRAHGLQVVPAVYPMRVPNDKRPALASWAEFHNELVGERVFAGWFGQGAKPNMGIITGRCSGNVFVVDLDIYKSGAAALWWDDATGGIEPETWRQTTGGGGKQVLLRAPPGLVISNCSTSIGVDVRGQGGFAMLPPSQHLSGKEYAWDDGFAPWDCEIADAPADVLAAVLKLAAEHPGSGGHERTSQPASAFDAWGNLIDGREKALAAWVWRAVLELHRRTSGEVTEEVAKEAFEDCVDLWERHTRTRIQGADNAEGLEREDRGRSALLAKWQHAMKKWGDKVAEEAAKPNPKGEPLNGDPESKAEGGTDRNVPLILSAEEFVAGFTPPDYVIDGMVQRGYLYSLTARTGHGKTAITMFTAQAVARGLPVKRLTVKQGSILILAGENPDDIRARFLILADAQGFAPRDVPIHFIAGVVDIAAEMPRIRAESERLGDLMLVIVDTAAAYFKGDDGNSNVQTGDYARLLRQLTTLPGKPAVIVNAHPIKNAARENLIPMGGSAFLNEVDGNLTLWSEGEGQTTLHWHGKFRGPEFEPITFRMDVKTSESVVDSNGQLMPSVVAVPIGDLEQDMAQRQQESDENILLAVIGMNKGASIAALAKKANFVGSNGDPQKSKVFRICQRLKEDKLIEMLRRKPRITPKGKKELGWAEKED